MGIIQLNFPTCQRDGHNLVDVFPSRCCLADLNPADGLLRLKNKAYGTGPASADWSYRFRLLDTCETCVRRLLAHPAVQRMRKKKSTANVAVDSKTDTVTALAGEPKHNGQRPRRLRGKVLA